LTFLQSTKESPEQYDNNISFYLSHQAISISYPNPTPSQEPCLPSPFLLPPPTQSKAVQRHLFLDGLGLGLAASAISALNLLGTGSLLKIYVSLVFHILFVKKHADMGREIEITRYYNSRKLKNYEPFIDKGS